MMLTRKDCVKSGWFWTRGVGTSRHLAYERTQALSAGDCDIDDDCDLHMMVMVMMMLIVIMSVMVIVMLMVLIMVMMLFK